MIWTEPGCLLFQGINVDYDIVNLLALPNESENIVSDYKIELLDSKSKTIIKKDYG